MVFAGQAREAVCHPARLYRRLAAGSPLAPNTNLHSNGGTGFQPVQARAFACDYPKLLFDCDFI